VGEHSTCQTLLLLERFTCFGSSYLCWNREGQYGVFIIFRLGVSVCGGIFVYKGTFFERKKMKEGNEVESIHFANILPDQRLLLSFHIVASV
jgi:hypothetical protein